MSARPTAAKAWWGAIRPATLWAAVAPVTVGTALAYDDGAFAPDAAGLALVGALLIQIGTNLFNDWADFRKGADTEARLGPARATQRGWLRPGQVLGGSLLAFGLALLCGGVLTWIAGWEIFVLGLVSVASGLAYTGGPWPLAYVGLGDVFVLAFFGVAATAGTYYVQALALSPASAVAGVALGALATAILVVNNLRDRETDAQASKRTLVVRFGAAFGRWEYTVCVVGAFGLVGVWAVVQQQPGWWLAWLTAPLAARQLKAIWTTDGAALNPHLGATAALQLGFGLALGAGVCL